MAREPDRQDLATGLADLPSSLERDHPVPVDREVDRPPHAGVVERAAPHVEVDPFGARRRRAAEPCRRLRRQRPQASRAEVAAERVREDRDVGGTALRGGDLLLDLPVVVEDDLDAVGEALPAGAGRARQEMRVALEGPAPPRIPGGDTVRPGAGRRAARRGTGRAAAGTTDAKGIVSLCRNSGSGRVRWTVMVRVRASVRSHATGRSDPRGHASPRADDALVSAAAAGPRGGRAWPAGSAPSRP